jgi:Protein of unknown function (DUF2924)
VKIGPALPDHKAEIACLRDLDNRDLRKRWHAVFGRPQPVHLPRHLLLRILAYRLQADRFGDLDGESKCLLEALEVQLTVCRDKMRARIPASSGLFTPNREISVCVRLCGGAGRTRTSSQRVMSQPCQHHGKQNFRPAKMPCRSLSTGLSPQEERACGNRPHR